MPKKFDAKATWSLFYKKYDFFNDNANTDKQKETSSIIINNPANKDIDSNVVLNQQTPSSVPKKAKSANDAATIIQKKWRSHIKHDLINVHATNYHSGNFLHLINSQKIKKSLNPLKLAKLKQAIDSLDWHAEIFKDKDFPYLVLALFDANKISQQEIYTLLDRYQISSAYQIKETYPILDESGELNDESLSLLLPTLEANPFTNDFSEEELNRFIALVKELPKSEQIFYTTDLGTLADSNSKLTLGQQLFQLGIYNVDATNNQLIHLSWGLTDALGLARYGIENYVRPVPKLGLLSIDDIEAGVRKNMRYTAMFFPEAKNYEEVHERQIYSSSEATEHDRYHTRLMSKIPHEILSALLHIVDVTRDATNFKWSKEIWSWVDAELEYVQNSEDAQQANEKNITSLTADERKTLFSSMPFNYLNKADFKNLSVEEMTDFFCELFLWVVILQKTYHMVLFYFTKIKKLRL